MEAIDASGGLDGSMSTDNALVVDTRDVDTDTHKATETVASMETSELDSDTFLDSTPSHLNSTNTSNSSTGVDFESSATTALQEAVKVESETNVEADDETVDAPSIQHIVSNETPTSDTEGLDSSDITIVTNSTTETFTSINPTNPTSPHPPDAITRETLLSHATTTSSSTNEESSLRVETSLDTATTPTNPMEVQTKQPQNKAEDEEDDDVSSKAAVALAAVAAAATANHKSPAEAAKEARAAAQSFIKPADHHHGHSVSSVKRTIQTVPLATVQTHLRAKALETGSVVADKLCQGENDAFLQYLLLLEYFRATVVHEDDDPDHLSIGSNHSQHELEQAARAAEACDKVLTLLKKIDLAYDSLVNMLPAEVERLQQPSFDEDSSDYDQDYETPVVIPDLLPPCTFPGGDKTVAFFKACMGTEGEAPAIASDDTSLEEVREQANSIDGNDSLDQPSTPTSKCNASLIPPASPKHPIASNTNVFSMFRRNTTPSKGILGSLRRRTGNASTTARDTDSSLRVSETTESTQAPSCRPGEYVVKIEREMLGLTVENVLERTVVRTVLASGPAKKAGAKIGSLIVKVGNVETKNLTHFETIDELRQSQRPLQLVLREVSEDALRLAREEMGRLIRGSGFGTIMDGNRAAEDGEQEVEVEISRPLIEADLRIDAYTNLIRRRIAEVAPQARNKKEEALARVGEKMVWLLTLFVIGFEREAAGRYDITSAENNEPTPVPRRSLHGVHAHSAKEYGDAAKSVSKVLLDYSQRKLDPQPVAQRTRSADFIQHSLETTGGNRRGRKIPPSPIQPQRGTTSVRAVPGAAQQDGSSLGHDKPLLQIGDVLQRTRTFLTDTTSPPAALLRGELIAFLCDVLDIDTDMELSEEDSVSATAGAQAGPINDLGSAGSLLKLIILNCPIMRSPGCEAASSHEDVLDPEFEEEMRRRFGLKEYLSAVDRHKLHAGNRFLAVVHRLAASRSMSARITACSLGPVIWGHLDFPHQLQLRGVVTRALHDVEVIVRKATATVLHEVAELVFDSRCVPWLVLMCERAMTDPEPQLRSAAMTLTWHLAEHLPNAFLGDASQGSAYLRRLPDRNDPIFADVYLLQCKLLPVATRLAEDRSPSVRLAVAAQCDRLCYALGDHWSSVVIDVLLAMLSDADERVRCEAVLCVPRLADIVLLSTSPGETAVSEVSILEALLPAAIKLQKDPSPSVRISLAAAAGDLLTLLVAMQRRSDESSGSSVESPAPSDKSVDIEVGRKYRRQVDDRLIPLVQQLLNDSDPEVTSAALRAVTNASRKSIPPSSPRNRQMSVASEDDSLSITSYQSQTSRDTRQPMILPVLSEVQVLRLLPTLTDLANSRQWRVRQSAVEIVPALLGCTQKLETRSEISKLCVRLMSDSVDAVRKTAAECLCMGGSSLGSHGEDASAEWTTSIVIPAIRRCAIHSFSKQRLLSLKMIEVVLLNGACPSKWKGSETDQERLTDSPMRELAAIALSLTSDRIANVRLNVGRILEAVLHDFEDAELSFIREVLLQQMEEEKEREGGGDRDVLFFAKRCVDRASTIIEETSSATSLV